MNRCARAAVFAAGVYVSAARLLAVDAPYTTVTNVAPTNLYYNAATGQFVGSGSLTSLIYQQYNPGGAPRPVGPPPPPNPPPGIDRTFAIDDIHFASPGTYHVTSFSFGMYIEPGSSGTFTGLVRAFENNATNSVAPDEIGGPSGKIYELQLTGMTGQPGTYRVVVFNVDFYSSQHLWLGVSTQSNHAAMIIAGDTTVEVGSSADLFAWEGYEGNQTYTPGVYTFGSGGPKADLTFEIGGSLEPAADFRWKGALFHEMGAVDPWAVPSNWQKYVGGNWQTANRLPGALDSITFDQGWLEIQLPSIAPVEQSAGVVALTDIRRFYGTGNGYGQQRIGTLTVGDVNGIVEPCFIIGDAAQSSRAGYLTVTGATAVRRGDLIITQGSSATLGGLTVGSTVASTVDPCYLTDNASTSVTSLSVPSGNVLVYRGGTFTNSGTTSIGTNIAGIVDPCFIVGDAADEFSSGAANMLGDVTVTTGDLIVRHPGSSLTIGLASNRKNLVIGDPSSPAEVHNPDFLVEHFGAATVHRQISLKRGTATIRTGGTVTSTLGGVNPSVLINGAVDPCFLVGDASGFGTLDAAGIVRVVQGELRLGHDESQVFADTLDVQSAGVLAGRGKVRVNNAVTFGGSLSPGEESSMGWGSVAGTIRFEFMPSVTLSAGAVTTMDLGTGRSVSDLITTTGNFTPGGTLVLRPVEGDVPPPGSVISIIQPLGVLNAGEFAVVDDTLMRQAGRRATVEYTPEGVNALVLCHADFDRNGFVTGDDFDSFVFEFELGTTQADYDGNGFTNGDDFDLFVADFEAGC